jgi:hypothetical protein
MSVEWVDVKIDAEWTLHQAVQDGTKTEKYILLHTKCPDGCVMPGMAQICTECDAPVPEGVLKRLPFLVHIDILQE